MSQPAPRTPGYPAPPKTSIEALLAAKNTRPIQSLDELAADTFSSDDELDEFLTYTRSERARDLS
ncbi:hypothetical protein AB0C07_01580 [Actinoplanes missouriensis]|uniref:hypothetical protein n=1 Tax=Actinoplanes missouriensis TaxID=1866 RepID=UPI0033FBCE28